MAKKKGAKRYVAYSRRFYESTLKAREIIESDGSIKSMHFEFTEWDYEIEKTKKANGVKDAWFFANSTNVVGVASYLVGVPVEMI